ncbi:MAG: hypothetical protein ACYCX2_10530 [Christensenellales bacterium]
MWITVTMAKSKEIADEIESLLSQEGLLVKTRRVYKNISDESNYYEIRVLKSEFEEAKKVLMERGY